MGRNTSDKNEVARGNRPIYASQAFSIVFSSFIYRAAWKQQDKKAKLLVISVIEDIKLQTCIYAIISAWAGCTTLRTYISIHKTLVSVHSFANISEKVIFSAGLWNTWLSVWNTDSTLHKNLRIKHLNMLKFEPREGKFKVEYNIPVFGLKLDFFQLLQTYLHLFS